MKLLLTSDTQAEFNNLDLCEISIQELIAAANKYKPDAIIHAGDLKELYNPCDLRVVKFWVRAVRAIKEEGFRFIILLGNHDRLSQSVDSKNWLDILRAAGAETISRPRVKQIGDCGVAFLPYTSDKKEELQWAKNLHEHTRVPMPSVCIFHTELSGAFMNPGIQARGNTLEDLYLDKYSAAFGGHLHMHQKVMDTIWYIGSPFCQDWGETNQKKGHLLATITGKSVSIKRLITDIPHWYDAEWLEENNVKPEKGAYIRSRVTVASKEINAQIQAEEERIRSTFPDSDIRLFVIPRLEKAKIQSIALDGVTDRENVAQYVAGTLSEAARFDARRVVAYLASKLLKIAPAASGKKIRFIKAVAENVLTYEKVKIRYSKQGLVLLKGKNLDWPKRSNGGGKTNALSLLPVALFGETLKGQKNDEWARERVEERAIVRLYLEDERERKIEIERGRRPHKINMWVDGKDVSTGLSGKGKQETQGQIVDITGYDLRMLLNSVYIDQTIANGFLFGTQKDRMDLVSKLVGLDRFDSALKLVTADIDANKRAIAEETAKIEKLVEDEERLTEELQDYISVTKSNVVWGTKVKEARRECARLREAISGYSASKDFYSQLQEEVDDLNTDEQELGRKMAEAHGAMLFHSKEYRQAEKLEQGGKCPVCKQDAAAIGKSAAKTAKAAMHKAEREANALLQSRTQIADKLRSKEGKIAEYHKRIDQANTDLAAARLVLDQAEQGAAEEENRNKKTLDKAESINRHLIQTRRFLKAGRFHLKNLDVDADLLAYSQKAFHRSGLPMYMSAALCPLLNKAAEEYSEIFTDGKIHIMFSVVDNDFRADIVNPTGSDTRNGQSVGESAMAGSIAAFAMREAAPKTNLLILDEPGHGLDTEGAKQFAKGLLKLKDRFETMLVTTHSPIIEAILAGETVWTAIKQNGISRLKTN